MAALGGNPRPKPGYAQQMRDNVLRPAQNNAAAARDNAAMAAGMGQEEVCCGLCPHLSMRERINGCMGCFCIGMIIGFLSTLSWWSGNIAEFAILYTLGNIISLCSSLFLWGPKRQWKNMSKAKRRWATALYFLMMILTLSLAFTHGPKPVILVAIFLQWCALIWYIASYIPFGQKMIKGCFSRITDF